MRIKVAKFGGSSLAAAGQFHKVRSIVTGDQERRYIINSAPGKQHPQDHKITDLLYECHANARKGIPFADVFEIVARRYHKITCELGLSLELRRHLEKIKEKIASGATADYVASRGEYLNGLILADFLGYDFVDAAEIIFFTPEGFYDPERSGREIAARLARHPRAVIPGFYGSLPDGGIKTFSRGGSDITGAIVARAVKASLYENWTDVSGFLMADPQIVKNPKPIERITYRELRELSYMGAGVLHEEAVFPVREAGIPVQIKNTNNPGAPGTLIVSDAEPVTRAGVVTGIAGRKDFTVIALEKTLMNAELGFGRRLLSILETHEISLEHMPTGIDTISVVVADSQLDGKLKKILEEIREQCRPDTLEVFSKMALIATVGRGMPYTPGIAARLFAALGNAGINVRMIDQGSSEINIIVGVATEDFDGAIRAIYHAFVK